MTARDEEILRMLCFSVRFFCLEQIARTWWTSSPREVRRARQRMHALSDSGWMRHTVVLARPLLNLTGPISEWRPGLADPDFVHVSRALQRRWRMPARKVEVFLASQKASAILGGASQGLVKHLCQATHDLHVADVFLFYLKNWPELATYWVGEDTMIPGSNLAKRPDAFLRSEQGTVVRVVEFGGAYKPDRVKALHEHCLKLNHPYEIW
jgi:hypothetical protein